MLENLLIFKHGLLLLLLQVPLLLVLMLVKSSAFKESHLKIGLPKTKDLHVLLAILVQPHVDVNVLCLIPFRIP